MPVWALGLNHHTAPLDLRSRFSFAPDSIEPALCSLRKQVSQHQEAAILSTCNRTEIYCAGEQATFDRTLHWLAHTGNMAPDALRKHAYTLQNAEATRHAFRVASGLDSMVLGEPQILGQMKNAMRAAQQAGSLGGTLNQLFQRSFAVAKQVRSSTAIGMHSISMAAAVVKLAMQHCGGNLHQARVLFVGAGEMIGLICTHFAAQAPAYMTIANRNPARGAALAARTGANLMPLAELPGCLHAFDIVVSCTASTLPLIGLGAVERAMAKRGKQPMLLVDLAVPRDIEPEVKNLVGITLYTVDDLAALVQMNQATRQAAVEQAEAIVDTGVHRFMHWLHKRDPQNGIVPLIHQIHQQANDWQQHELARARKQLARGTPLDDVLENLTRRLNNKMLHGILRELHHSTTDSQAQALDWARKIFLRHYP